MSFNRIWTIFYDNFDLLLSGLWVTVQISLIAFCDLPGRRAGAVPGDHLADARSVRAPAIPVVEFCRNTPILVQLVWVHFAWPEILGVTLSPWQSAVTALCAAIERLSR